MHSGALAGSSKNNQVFHLSFDPMFDQFTETIPIDLSIFMKGSNDSDTGAGEFIWRITRIDYQK